MNDLIKILNEIYYKTYGHPVIGNTMSPKVKDNLEMLFGVLNSVKPLEDHIQTNVFSYYISTVIAYLHRSFDFNPTLSHICSNKFTNIIDKYKTGREVLPSENFMLQPLHPIKKRVQGKFFGYDFDAIKSFSPKDSSSIYLVRAVLERKDRSFAPSDLLIELLDRVVFLCLGNNYIIELYNKSTELFTAYGWLQEVVNLKNYYLKKKKELGEKELYDALGYNLKIPIGKIKVSYCEALLWMKGLQSNDSFMISMVQKCTKQPEGYSHQDLAKEIGVKLLEVRNGISKAEWPYLRTALFEIELPKAKTRLITFKKGAYNEEE